MPSSPAPEPAGASAAYRLVTGGRGPLQWVDVTGPLGGPGLVRLSLLSCADRDGVRDETVSLGTATGADNNARQASLVLERVSTAWQRASVSVQCHPSHLIVRHHVEGSGRLGRTWLLGGFSLGPAATGPVYSGTELPLLFCPGPDDPRHVERPATSAAVVGVSGDSMAGRAHWFFTPAPLCFALGRPGGPWTMIGLLEPVQRMNFPELAYRPMDRGFRLEVDYEGHTFASGSHELPAVAVIPGVDDPYEGLEAYRHLLVDYGLVPQAARPSSPSPAWWSEPMFCGWGAQCHLANAVATAPQAQCTQANYDAFLAHLAGEGLSPGTVVVDDGWQEAYALASPHPERWPALREWVAHQHQEGKRVLLWWRAWSPQGAPPAACMTNPAGEPVAAGPFDEASRQWFAQTVRELLSPDGLDADGLKVDFTASTPRGWHISGPTGGADEATGAGRLGEPWGISLLHDYLSELYAAAKAAKADALVVTQAANPGFGDVTDMVRLNDILRLDEQEPWAPVVEQMTYRARVVRAACPGKLVDTDDWCAPDLGQWREYLEVKGGLGVPVLYYATHLDRTGEQLEPDDYEALRRTWSAARAAVRRAAAPAKDGAAGTGRVQP